MRSLYSQTFEGVTFIPPRVTFPASPSVVSSATVGTAVGTATLTGMHSGTATWSLTNSAGGKYAIDSASGAVTVAAGLVAGSDTIAISVSGISPTPINIPFSVNITVTSGSPALDFSDPNNSQYLGPIV